MMKMGPTTTGEIRSEDDALAQHLLSPGGVVRNRHAGSGAFGDVFFGTCLGQPCAIKTMKDVTTENVRSFRREILMTATLRHPNIVQFVGACWGCELMCLVLEWCPKGSLAAMLEDSSNELVTLEWHEPLLKIAVDIARGLAYLHSRSYFDEVEGELKSCIIHRDVKPDNVLITEFLSAKLTGIHAHALE